jgi:hypothetical protein
MGFKPAALNFLNKMKSQALSFVLSNAVGMLLATEIAGCGLPHFACVAAGSAHIGWHIRSVDCKTALVWLSLCRTSGMARWSTLGLWLTA